MNNSIIEGKRFHHLNLDERETIMVLIAKDYSVYYIANHLQRHPSTIYRELRRNSSVIYKTEYKAHRAQQRAENRWIENHQKERLKCPQLRNYVIKGLKKDWSPEQIAGRLSIENRGFKTNHESIYQFIYSESRDLIKNLRRSHRVRRKRGSAYQKRAPKVQNRTMIDKRPKMVEDREEPGHWEADTMISRSSKDAGLIAIERKSRKLFLSKLNRKSAEQVRKKLNCRLSKIPVQLRKTITFDNGTENAEHELIASVLGVETYFCHPYSSWEKGSVENVIGLIRQYIPKKTDLSKIEIKDIKIIESRINNRPRKCLGFKTPNEVYSEIIAFIH